LKDTSQIMYGTSGHLFKAFLQYYVININFW